VLETNRSPPPPTLHPPLRHYEQVMGGRSSSFFQDYHTLCVQALTEIRKHAEAVIILMEIMTHKSSFPAFRLVPGACLEGAERGFRGDGEGGREGTSPSTVLCGTIKSELVHSQYRSSSVSTFSLLFSLIQFIIVRTVHVQAVSTA
jgi:hypothetical protein